MTWRAGVDSGRQPRAVARTVMSRSVTTPTSRPRSSTVSMPTLRWRIFAAAVGVPGGTGLVGVASGLGGRGDECPRRAVLLGLLPVQPDVAVRVGQADLDLGGVAG